jgi:hypothetical protein
VSVRVPGLTPKCLFGLDEYFGHRRHQRNIPRSPDDTTYKGRRVHSAMHSAVSVFPTPDELHPPRIDAGTFTSTGSQSSAIHHHSTIPPLYCIIVGLITSSFIRIIDTRGGPVSQSVKSTGYAMLVFGLIMCFDRRAPADPYCH